MALAALILALGGAVPSDKPDADAGKPPETEMEVTGLSAQDLKACLPAKLARWQGYRPRQPGPDPDIVDYDRRDMTPAYRLTFIDTEQGVSVRVVNHVALDPLTQAIQDCIRDAAQPK
jgi:hypothetical protein